MISGEKRTHTDWVFPPRCVQDNSYNYTMYWFVDYIDNVYYGVSTMTIVKMKTRIALATLTLT